ncbi:ferredoxin, 2Fe-2S [Catalinimonas alkaloidigena]|uniref:Ferredoxin, 2Fe-2S n=1 Tax=Catalinimonas alkaloidigena TaxID=1075417 RepID=A0A1G9RSG2_9BACT|nr:2Fe-2S iron-sulfur cluster-binding protein [Catalinimonas alkaloidigena]SDM26102.1 ferredoxin, 2Fe-2S [Catalinimonas alkaloidigena]
MDLVKFTVNEPDGSQTELEAPTDMGLSLMEFLKASEYPIQATCGGMALCATCHIRLENADVPEPEDAELDMLDTLPYVEDESRLSCQIRIADGLHGASITLLAAEE